MLVVTVPCCDVETSLNELVYDWPMGFARFRIEILYPNRAWLTDEELTALTDALGHPLRQILIHIQCRVSGQRRRTRARPLSWAGQPLRRVAATSGRAAHRVSRLVSEPNPDPHAGLTQPGLRALRDSRR